MLWYLPELYLIISCGSFLYAQHCNEQKVISWSEFVPNYLAKDIVQRVELDTWGWGQVILKAPRKEKTTSTWLETFAIFSTTTANKPKQTSSSWWKTLVITIFPTNWFTTTYNCEGKTIDIYIRVGSQTFFEDKVKQAYKELRTESKSFINIVNKGIISSVSCSYWMNVIILIIESLPLVYKVCKVLKFPPQKKDSGKIVVTFDDVAGMDEAKTEVSMYIEQALRRG